MTTIDKSSVPQSYATSATMADTILTPATATIPSPVLSDLRDTDMARDQSQYQTPIKETDKSQEQSLYQGIGLGLSMKPTSHNSSSSLPTPPTSQHITHEHDVEQNIDHDPPLISSPTKEIFGPLLSSPEPSRLSPLPNPFSRPFNFHRFGMLVEDVVYNRHELHRYLNKNISVLVDEPTFKHCPERLVPFNTLWRSARKFITLEIDGIEQRCGREVADYIPSCLPEPWFKAMRLAYENQLDNIVSPSTLERISQAYDSLFPVQQRTSKAKRLEKKITPEMSFLEIEPRQTRKRPTNNPETPEDRIPRIATPADQTPSVEVERKRKASSASITPARNPPKKRKASSNGATPGDKEGKRHEVNLNDPKSDLTRATRFGRAVKGMLNERSKDIAAYTEFEDALRLCPQNTRITEEDERAFANEKKIAWDVYLCTKYRLFLGTAILTEQNLRLQKVVRDWGNNESHGKKDKGEKPSLHGHNVTQVQLWNNIDVNKTSVIFKQFVQWGWFPSMLDEGRKIRAVTEEYKALYPAHIRLPLFEKVMQWEDVNVTKVGNRAAIQETGY